MTEPKLSGEKSRGLVLLESEPIEPLDPEILKSGELPPAVLDDARMSDRYHRANPVRVLPGGVVSYEEDLSVSETERKEQLKQQSDRRQRLDDFIARAGASNLIENIQKIPDMESQHSLLMAACRKIAEDDPDEALNIRMREELRFQPQLDNEDIASWRNLYTTLRQGKLENDFAAELKDILMERTPEAFVRAYDTIEHAPWAERQKKRFNNGVDDTVSNFMTINFGTRSKKILACFSGLPSDFPHLEELARKTYSAYESDMNKGRVRRTSEEKIRDFSAAPEILLNNIGKFRASGFDAEKVDALFDAVDGLGNRERFLANVSLDQLSPKKADAVHDRMFDVYRKHNPLKIAFQIEKFHEEFTHLPQEEQRKIVEDLLKQNQRSERPLVDVLVQIRDLTGMVPDAGPVMELQKELIKHGSVTRLEQMVALAQTTGVRLPTDSTFVEQANTAITDLQQKEPGSLLKLQKAVSDLLPPGQLQEAQWTKSFERIEKLQGRTANAEHDPWLSDFQPLIRSAVDQKVVDGSKPEDGEVLYEFVRQFGMANMPNLFRWHAAIQRSKDVASIPEPVRNEIEQTLRIKLAKLDNKGLIINEIKRFSKRIQENLLADQVPRGIDSPVGAEVFKNILGQTNWSRGDKVEDIMRIWAKTSKDRPEVGKLRPEFQEVTFQVPLRERRKLSPDQRAEWKGQREELEEAPKVQKARTEVEEAFSGSMKPEELLQRFAEWRAKVIPTLSAQLETARQGSNLVHMKQLEESIDDLQTTDPSPDSAGYTKAISRMAQHLDVTGDGDSLRSISASHMRMVMPKAWQNRITKHIDAGKEGKATPASTQIEFWSTVMRQYINEHYLNESQNRQHTGHDGFSPTELERLKEVWRLQDGVDKQPVCEAKNKLEGLDEVYQWRNSEKTLPVSLVPVRGPLRIYAGDIGDACYSSKHAELANGDYGDLTAYVFVTNRNTPKERIRGSVLAVEAQSEAGEPVLVVRANNPQEGFIQQVDPNALVDQTLNEMRALAKRLKATDTLVPRDPASTSSSNRPSVSKRYEKEFRKARKVGLKMTPETNFNGYANWDAKGNNAVVSIG